MGWLRGDTEGWAAFWNFMGIAGPVFWLWLGYQWGHRDGAEKACGGVRCDRPWWCWRWSTSRFSTIEPWGTGNGTVTTLVYARCNKHDTEKSAAALHAKYTASCDEQVGR